MAVVLKSAQITAVVNDVKVVDPVKGERRAGVKDVVQGSLGIKTGLQSRAELVFQDKTLTRLGANTLFSFNEGTRELELERGTMLLQVPKNVGGARIRTAAVTAAITGTTILLEYSPVKWKASRPPGVSADVALMAPEQCLMELQHPKRKYSTPDLSELRRKAALAKKAAGHVKVMVLEGTLRLFLTNKLGESTLISAGQMIILSPNALTIPPAVNFDIAQLAKTSLLVNNANWGGSATAVNMASIAREIQAQEQLKGRGTLTETNLVILGGGTAVFTVAQLQRVSEARQTALLEQQPTTITSGDSGNGQPLDNNVPPVGGGSASDTPVGAVLPGFNVQGSTTSVTGGAPSPPTSSSIPGNFTIAQSLPGTIPVLPTDGSDFALFSTAGSVPGGQSRTATNAISDFSFPTTPPGTRQALTFDYRFFSNETNQGLTFPDQFNVTILRGNESIVLALDRNALSPGGTGTLTPVAQAGVAGFLGGTDWLSFVIDITPFAGSNGTVSFLIWDVGDASVDSAFAVDNFTTKTYPVSTQASIPGKLTLNFNSLALGSNIGEYAIPNLEGLPARNNSGPAADVGTFVVNTSTDLALNAPLNASTGANGAGSTFGGKGGTVQFNSANGAIAINSTLTVSDSATAGGKASAAGGSIAIATSKTSGPGITIANTGELLSLLNSTAPGPGGTIQVTSAGATISVNGKIQADRGTVDVRNNGAAGQIFINSTAQLAADVIKVGALGTNGQLTVHANSQINAVNTLKLYGGTGAGGKVLFTGAGNVNLSGSNIHIRANTVQIDAATHVNNNGATTVHATTHSYNPTPGGGGGQFQNPVTTTGVAPSFD